MRLEYLTTFVPMDYVCAREPAPIVTFEPTFAKGSMKNSRISRIWMRKPE